MVKFLPRKVLPSKNQRQVTSKSMSFSIKLEVNCAVSIFFFHLDSMKPKGGLDIDDLKKLTFSTYLSTICFMKI